MPPTMGTSRRSLGLFRNALNSQARRGGDGAEWLRCSSRRRLLASVSDSQFSGLEMPGDRNVDIFDRALKSKQVNILLLEPWVLSRIRSLLFLGRRIL